MSTFNLKKGMIFKTYQDFSDFVGYQKTSSRSELRSRLKHHCMFHKDKNNIIIDDVFDAPEMYTKCISDFIYNIGDIVNISTGKIEILDKYFKSRKNGENIRYYKCRCCNDGYEYEISQYSLRKGVGCMLCLGMVVSEGINDINTTHPHIANLMKNDDDKKKYSAFSRKLVPFICPNCKNERILKISYVTETGKVICQRCSDGLSYPNKFVYCAIKQVCNDLETEKIFTWSNKKRYDLFSIKNNLIIENHGRFHYEEQKQIYNQQYRYTMNNDIYKKTLALNNGIRTYIELDCRKSNCNWIKKSIMNSDLPKILSFSENDIDWNICDEYATSSVIKDVYELYKNGITNKKEIASILQIGYSTCCNYFTKAINIYEK